MTHFLWQIYLQTPTWIWGMLALMIYISIQATRPLVIPVKRLLISPILFLILSVMVIYYVVPLIRINILFWFCALLVGCFIGWYQMRFLRIKAVTNTTSIYVPGTWSLLVLCFILIASKFYLNYRLSFINASILKDPRYVLLFIGLYGLFTGMFFGRIIHACYCLKFGPYVTYEEIKQARPWR